MIANTVLVGSSGSRLEPNTFPPLYEISDLTCISSIWLITCFCSGENDWVACLRNEKKSFSSPKDDYNFCKVLKCGRDKEDILWRYL